jgi:glycosyltransferase involved in cell wall biosynthesis
MTFLWLSWKDISNPQSGGAELVMHELSKRLIKDGHSVTILTVSYPGSLERETIDGIDIIRVGKSRYLHPLTASIYYIRNLRNQYDTVIDVVNTAPYMSPFYKGKKTKSYLFYHQLAREIWFYETPFPISLIGYSILEPVATTLLGKSSAHVITISDSTKKDLTRFGFNEKKIHVIPEGITSEPVEDLLKIKKYHEPTVLIFGAARSMKRGLDQIKAFEIAKATIPNLKLKIAGSMTGPYGKKIDSYIKNSVFRKDIECLDRVSEADKFKLMQKVHVLLAASVKEGWCLVVSEAASQGTPSVVYNVDGLRDSVKNDKTGIVCKKTPSDLAQGIVKILGDSNFYENAQNEGLAWSKQLTFDRSYSDFKSVLELK